MPTYGYECKTCKHTFDAFQSINEEPLKTCPECGKELRRLINGGTGVIFKGGGYYVTDKGGKTSNAPKPDAPKSAPCSSCKSSETAACPKAVNS
ncbi:MAG: zinc ribbon domain-containing protein [Treponema sp.]|nr:zinc ribbon domain-containing protein [Treponema sp.]